MKVPSVNKREGLMLEVLVQVGLRVLKEMRKKIVLENLMKIGMCIEVFKRMVTLKMKRMISRL